MTSTEKLAARSPQFRAWMLFVQEHLNTLGYDHEHAQQIYSFAKAYEACMSPYEAASNYAMWQRGD